MSKTMDSASYTKARVDRTNNPYPPVTSPRLPDLCCLPKSLKIYR